jgi:hypothetical protein
MRKKFDEEKQKEVNRIIAKQLLFLSDQFDKNEFNFISGGFPKYNKKDVTKPEDEIQNFKIANLVTIKLKYNQKNLEENGEQL